MHDRTKPGGLVRELARNRYLYLLTLPGILYFLVFCYMPLIGLYIAFVDYNPLAGAFGLLSPFVGFENFRFFFTSNDWLLVTANTLWLNLLFITTGLAVQIFMAVALNEIANRRFKKIAQSFMFLPNFLSWTVVSVLSLALFSTDEGVVNKILTACGGTPVNFYQEAGVWPLLLVLLRLWKGVGFGTVIYLSTITSIDQELFEAARIDGANRLQGIVSITLPLLRGTTVMLLIMAVGGIFYGDFGMIYALVGDNPMLRDTTDVIDTFVYRALRLNNDVGMSSAVGLFQSVIGFFMVIGANAFTRRIDRESSLF